MKDISIYQQLRDDTHIHLATTAWDEKRLCRDFFLLCRTSRSRLKIIDPVHYQRFGWDAHPELRCPKCSDAVDPKLKKGAA